VFKVPQGIFDHPKLAGGVGATGARGHRRLLPEGVENSVTRASSSLRSALDAISARCLTFRAALLAHAAGTHGAVSIIPRNP
jgi:hypothetical protein